MAVIFPTLMLIDIGSLNSILNVSNSFSGMLDCSFFRIVSILYFSFHASSDCCKYEGPVVQKGLFTYSLLGVGLLHKSAGLCFPGVNRIGILLVCIFATLFETYVFRLLLFLFIQCKDTNESICPNI